MSPIATALGLVACSSQLTADLDRNHGHSLTTVVLSLLSDCPTFAFYVLEIIVNTAMIAEVSIRLVAFGKVSPRGFSSFGSALIGIADVHSNSGSPITIL